MLDRLLIQRQARENGICPVREELYNQAFGPFVNSGTSASHIDADEIIRQVTINCAERGFLLLRIRDELRMRIAAYQTLYESSIAFGLRKALQAEQGKAETEEKVLQRIGVGSVGEGKQAKNLRQTSLYHFDTSSPFLRPFSPSGSASAIELLHNRESTGFQEHPNSFGLPFLYASARTQPGHCRSIACLLRRRTSRSRWPKCAPNSKPTSAATSSGARPRRRNTRTRWPSSNAPFSKSRPSSRACSPRRRNTDTGRCAPILECFFRGAGEREMDGFALFTPYPVFSQQLLSRSVFCHEFLPLSVVHLSAKAGFEHLYCTSYPPNKLYILMLLSWFGFSAPRSAFRTQSTHATPRHSGKTQVNKPENRGTFNVEETALMCARRLGT